MGIIDRLREEGKTEEEIAEELGTEDAQERPQNPETKRVAHDTVPYTGIPYSPPPQGDDGSDAGVEAQPEEEAPAKKSTSKKK